MKTIKYINIFEFFKKNSSFIESPIDNDMSFNKLKSITNADVDDLTFFSNKKYLTKLKNTKAKACLIDKKYISFLPKTCLPIIVEDPYLAFAKLSQLFSNDHPLSSGIISNKSCINENTKISDNVQIDPFCYIDKNTEINENVIIGTNCKIGPDVLIKQGCVIQDNVTISNTIIMENCEIQSGARIGGSGFGFEEKTKQKILHGGNVIINKNSTIGSNTTIDRAVFDSTYIGEYSQLDNLVQIAHNVSIGKHAIIAAQVGIAGSTIIGDFVKIGGQAGIAGHLEIGNNVVIAAKSGVTKNILDNKIVAGFPAKDINIWKKEIINIGKIK